MARHNEIGKIGENTVAAEYEKRGYKVLAANYVSRGNELDLVLYKHKTVVFTEVKSRSSDTYGTPREAVDAAKQKCIINASHGFISEQVKDGYINVWSRLLKRGLLKKVKNYRYDIAEVYFGKDGVFRLINIIENAFDSGEKRFL